MRRFLRWLLVPPGPGSGRRAREHSVQVEVDQAFERLLFRQGAGIDVAEEALHLGGLHQQGAQPPRREPVRHRAKLAGFYSPPDHVLDQAAGTEDHFLEVELGQLGKLLSSAWTSR